MFDYIELFFNPQRPRVAGANGTECSLLHRVDLAQEILQFGVRLAQDAHAADIANIASKVTAGIA